MEYQEKLKVILLGIRPQFEIPGTYAFLRRRRWGRGCKLLQSSYEGYSKAKELTKAESGTAEVELA